mgnify:CR=1 FL=1
MPNSFARSGIAILAFMCVFFAGATNCTPASVTEIAPQRPNFGVPLADEATGIDCFTKKLCIAVKNW